MLHACGATECATPGGRKAIVRRDCRCPCAERQRSLGRDAELQAAEAFVDVAFVWHGPGAATQPAGRPAHQRRARTRSLRLPALRIGGADRADRLVVIAANTKMRVITTSRRVVPGGGAKRPMMSRSERQRDWRLTIPPKTRQWCPLSTPTHD